MTLKITNSRLSVNFPEEGQIYYTVFCLQQLPSEFVITNSWELCAATMGYKHSVLTLCAWGKMLVEGICFQGSANHEVHIVNWNTGILEAESA